MLWWERCSRIRRRGWANRSVNLKQTVLFWARSRKGCSRIATSLKLPCLRLCNRRSMISHSIGHWKKKQNRCLSLRTNSSQRKTTSRNLRTSKSIVIWKTLIFNSTSNVMTWKMLHCLSLTRYGRRHCAFRTTSSLMVTLVGWPRPVKS